MEDIIDHYNLDELRYNRYRITALTDKQAQSVIEKTFRNSIEDISSDDLKRITSIIIPTAKGQNEYADIRTPILSLLGSLIYKQLVAGYNLDSIDTRSTNNELYLYYDDIMSEPKIPLEVRWFLEQKLITVDGRRDSMDYQSALLTNQINEEQIEYLVKEKKILRIVEVSAGERRLEFSHDTICKALNPIIKMRDGFYNNGNELYFSSFDVEEKQPEMVKYLSYAAELGHLEAKRQLANLYKERVKGTIEDQHFKSTKLKRDRLVILLNGGEWETTHSNAAKIDDKYDVFLSYSRSDMDVAKQVLKELQTIGCTVWMDVKKIESGSNFVNTIIDAIKSSKIFIFLASPNTFDSSFARRELEYAEKIDKRTIFLKIDDSPMPNLFRLLYGTRDIVDIRNEAQKNKLFREIQRFIGHGTNPNEIITLDDYQIEMIYIEGGIFTMGATLQQGGENPDERIIHDVRLDSYYIAKVPVTQELWEKVMGRKSNGIILNEIFINKEDSYRNMFRPVDNVSWNDCITFIRCLNALTGKDFRLPSEAEWEYAAKGGTKGRFNGYKYSGGNNLNNVAWISENSGGSTHEVAKKQPNELGIYDMSGNVWEWCSDWYAPYPNEKVTNPRGPKDGNKKVCRGGSWNDKGKDCRISRREARDPLTKNAYIGFRLVL